MKITKVDILHAHKVSLFGDRPVLCRIYTDEGIYGDGEAALGFGNISEAATGMIREMAPLIIGMNPMEHEVIWKKLYSTIFWARGGGPVVFGAISAIDIAIWDIKGKALNMPVYELLGGKCNDRLHAYASQLQNGYGSDRGPGKFPDEYARYTALAMEDGFDAVKLNFMVYDSLGRRRPVNDQTFSFGNAHLKLVKDRVAAVRKQLGPDGDIILENHCISDVQSAIQMGNAVKEYGIMYYEEPVTPRADLLRAVYEGCGIPVASGERIFSRGQYKEHFEKQSIQVIQPDLGTSGGFTEVKKICDMAELYEVGVQIHVCGSPLIASASIQLEAAIPSFTIHEYNVNTNTEGFIALTKYNPVPVRSYLDVPDLPGIGNEISEKAFTVSDVYTVE
ncbi:MAG: mandelate racemase/muconate lactonizing enzyme family protein [Lachnospiraceae bacterium]|nr:mandelate racemase/muconate lactonizing enzyme family protein [Lachnospiraceae bacterium]